MGCKNVNPLNRRPSQTAYELELGARGDPWPTEEKIIQPYAAEDYPAFFEDADTTVRVLSARRTFWEKASALHAEAHRPSDAPTPQYFSRHFYDLAMLLDTEDGKATRSDFDLLAQVAKHKAVFFVSDAPTPPSASCCDLRFSPCSVFGWEVLHEEVSGGSQSD